MVLTMYDIVTNTRWDIDPSECTSSAIIYQGPGATGLSTGKAVATTSVTEQEWTKANYFAVLTMRKNCEKGALSKIGITEDAGI